MLAEYKIYTKNIQVCVYAKCVAVAMFVVTTFGSIGAHNYRVNAIEVRSVQIPIHDIVR